MQSSQSIRHMSYNLILLQNGDVPFADIISAGAIVLQV